MGTCCDVKLFNANQLNLNLKFTGNNTEHNYKYNDLSRIEYPSRYSTNHVISWRDTATWKHIKCSTFTLGPKYVIVKVWYAKWDYILGITVTDDIAVTELSI